MHVANLDEIALWDYRWKDVRDSLRRAKALSRGIRSIEHLAYTMAFIRMKHADWFSKSHNAYSETYNLFWSFISGEGIYTREEVISFFDHVDDLSADLEEFVVKHDLIRLPEEGSAWMDLTEKGAGLFRQKSLRRISHKEAGRKLVKALAAARSFNEDKDQSYVISRIVLFGSLMHGNNKDVGDIDIMIKKDPRYNRKSRKEWLDEQKQILKTERPSALYSEFIPTREMNADKAIKKISPYISIEPYYSYEEFKKEGVPMTVIFDLENPAKEALEKLAEEIDCYELVEQVWDA